MFHFWVTLFRTKVAKVTKKQKFFGEQKLQRNKVEQKTFVLLCSFVTFVLKNFCLKKKTSSRCQIQCAQLTPPIFAQIIGFMPNANAHNPTDNARRTAKY
jgi:hypothetical protein